MFHWYALKSGNEICQSKALSGLKTINFLSLPIAY